MTSDIDGGRVERDTDKLEIEDKATVYLAGPASDGENPYAWHERIEAISSECEWLNPFELNDYTREEAQNHVDEVAEQDFEAVRNADAVFVRRIDDYNLCGASMEAREAVLNDVPVVVWNDADTDIPLMLESQATEVCDYPQTAISEIVRLCYGTSLSESGNYAAFSGGNDSLVMAHRCMERGDTDAVLHLDTYTGVPQNREHVIALCHQYDWPLRIETPTITLTEFAKRWGFPGSGAHSWAFRYFKAHSIQRLVKHHDHPHIWTGVRTAESNRRMRTIEGEKQVDDTGKWTWRAPIRDWSERDCQDYQAEHDLPINPVTAAMHRSAECLCGAFSRRDEELIDLAANYPVHHEWLQNIEQEVQAEIGTGEAHCFWGHGGMSSKEVRGLVASHDDAQMVLCADCEPGIDRDYATVTDGGSE